MRIALFSTCIVDGMYPRVARATVEILERLGHEVVFPPNQTCCSQMHVNSGYFDDGYEIVKNHVEAFDSWDWDVAVAPSGSCVASLRDQHAAEQLGSYFPEHVTYHSSCHGMRLLRLGTRQQDLVRTVEGIKYTQIEGMDQCCGFGGTFSFKNPDVSGAMVNDKADNVEATGASICTGGDCSCLMNIGGALSRRGSDVKTIHFAEILASTKENPLKIDSKNIELSIA